MKTELPVPWANVGSRFREHGLRWTAQRRTVVEVLAAARGHVTGAEVVDRCRERDPQTTPSTVYRTLDALEALGLVRHAHGPDGREEYHPGPVEAHGHLYCAACGASEQISGSAASRIRAALRDEHDYEVDLSHVTVVGRCPDCRAAGA
jgi:Fur family ferric uptake transcriptional regulator